MEEKDIGGAPAGRHCTPAPGSTRSAGTRPRRPGVSQPGAEAARRAQPAPPCAGRTRGRPPETPGRAPSSPPPEPVFNESRAPSSRRRVCHRPSRRRFSKRSATSPTPKAASRERRRPLSHEIRWGGESGRPPAATQPRWASERLSHPPSTRCSSRRARRKGTSNSTAGSWSSTASRPSVMRTPFAASRSRRTVGTSRTVLPAVGAGGSPWRSGSFADDHRAIFQCARIVALAEPVDPAAMHLQDLQRGADLLHARGEGRTGRGASASTRTRKPEPPQCTRVACLTGSAWSASRSPAAARRR